MRDRDPRWGLVGLLAAGASWGLVLSVWLAVRWIL